MSQIMEEVEEFQNEPKPRREVGVGTVKVSLNGCFNAFWLLSSGIGLGLIFRMRKELDLNTVSCLVACGALSFLIDFFGCFSVSYADVKRVLEQNPDGKWVTVSDEYPPTESEFQFVINPAAQKWVYPFAYFGRRALLCAGIACYLWRLKNKKSA